MAGFDDAVSTAYSFLGFQATSNVAIILSMLVIPILLGMIAASFSTDSNLQLKVPSSIVTFIRYALATSISLVIAFLLVGSFSSDSTLQTRLIKNAYYVVFATSALVLAIALVVLLGSSRFQERISLQPKGFVNQYSTNKVALLLVLISAVLGWVLFSHPIPINQQYLMFVISGTYYESVGLALSVHLLFLFGILLGIFLLLSSTSHVYLVNIPKSSFFLGLTHSILIGVAYLALGYFSTVYYMFFSSLLVSVFLFSMGGVLALVIVKEETIISI